jgi:DNA primase
MEGVIAVAGQLPAEFIDDLRARVDILELISEYVILKRTGQNYVGLCPFHSEKTPSFTVSPGKQIFYCFGCGAGGNVFSFLMKRDHLTFPEAVEVLAQRLGVAVPRSETPAEQKQRQGRTQNYALNEAAARFYHRVLAEEPAGRPGRDYLLGRQVEQESWERFLLGFAAGSGHELTDYLERQGFPRSLIAEAGFDRFHGRVIFPICDGRGRCLGFGGRTLGDDQPKYLNSSETATFSKGRNLYGLHLAAEGIKKQGRVLVVEGYLDCITCHQYGFTNVVAALGTAFTHDQARLLLRFSKEIVLGFDSDAAGSMASVRGAGYLQDLGAHVYVLDLPTGKDPDEFLHTQGAEAFALALEERVVPHLEFRLQQLMQEHDPDSVLGRDEIVGELMGDLAECQSLVVREGYVKLIAERLKVSEDVLRRELVRYLERQRSKKDRIAKNRYNMEQSKQTFVNQEQTAVELARRGLFRFMCADRQIYDLVVQEIGLETFPEKIRRFLEMAGERQPAAAELLDLADPEDQGDLASLLLDNGQEPDWEQRNRMICDFLRTLKKEDLNQRIKKCQDRLKEQEKNRDKEGLWSVLAELHSLYEELEAAKVSYQQLNF